MIDTEGSIPIVPTDRKAGQEQSAGGLVVQGEKATSYVGGTHFMAILEDVSAPPSLNHSQHRIGD